MVFRSVLSEKLKIVRSINMSNKKVIVGAINLLLDKDEKRNSLIDTIYPDFSIQSEIAYDVYLITVEHLED